MGALTSSGIMALAGLGDAILYPVLPIYAERLGLPLVSVGFLLSINRFVRVISNTWIANIINSIGMKKVLLWSSCFAVITTFVYGLKLGLITFAMARIIWGLSYSGLKISTQNYASKVKSNVGFTFGITQSIKSLGALVALCIGPILISTFGIESTLFVIASISSVAIILSFTLSNLNHTPTNKVKTKQTFSFTTLNLLITFLAISIDGILVVVLANLLNDSSISTPQLLILVASYLLLKRIAMVGVSLISGMLTLKIESLKLFSVSIIICILAMFLIAINFTILGVIIAFMANAIVVTFSPLIAIEQQTKSDNSLQIISSVSTWWDLGAGLGAFLGIVLIEYIGQYYLFLALTILITALFINFIIQNGKTNRTTI
ncbi:MFS transporter [Wocania ichthyoenteri]|uniref:MFS transporter n=1 Tax=Wocania ichthyoenteri TaxID=1230531 RepID=UPI0012DFED09|nr:MFS transporter [Wocania ichthyoenteri]